MISTQLSEVETSVILKAVRAVPPQEATEAIKPILGNFYAKDTRNVWRALWEGMPSSSAFPACASDLFLARLMAACRDECPHLCVAFWQTAGG